MSSTRDPMPSSEQEIASQVDAYIDRLFGDLELPPLLTDALRYAALGPGKRIRPVLSWHAAIACGGKGAESLHAGAAVELVHAFSLVHDDLPALDNDDIRRGRPTLHRHTGEAMAILAGDALLTLSFGALALAPVDEAGRMALVRELTRATTGMITGQVYDTLGGLPQDLDPEQQVVLIHSNKTGALIRAACVMGAMSVRPAPGTEVLRSVDAYAEAVGLMFQIVDDLIDVTQTASHTGKRTGKDAGAGKLTYPAVLGIEGSRTRVAALLDRALEAVEPLGGGADGLRQIARTLAQRTR
jgi:geranylgeranyl pyrophosphate synthase